SFSTAQNLFTAAPWVAPLSAAGCSPFFLSASFWFFLFSASIFFMYFSGSLLKSLMQSAQQNATVLPLYCVVTAGSIFSSVSGQVVLIGLGFLSDFFASSAPYARVRVQQTNRAMKIRCFIGCSGWGEDVKPQAAKEDETIF